MSTKKKKTKAEMIDDICGPADEAPKQTTCEHICIHCEEEAAAKEKDAEDWYHSEVVPANPPSVRERLEKHDKENCGCTAHDPCSFDHAELIDQIEFGLYAMMADAKMLMRMLDRLRDEQRAYHGKCDK